MDVRRLGYKRVSSLDQNPERQLIGTAVDQVFADFASAKDAHRPELQRLLASARPGDTIVAHSIDRLARNLEDLRRIVNDCTARGIRVQFVQEGLLFSGDDSALATLLLSIMGAFAEFERALIRERQREGIALAKAHGAYKGGTPKLSPALVDELRQLAAAGTPRMQLARRYRLSRQTIYRYLA
jgi:DNA invertase Pin-like site-specific DNA recombinase